MNREGLIVKGIGGFYYVDCGDEIVECRARGVFRKKGITPTVGDYCSISAQEGEMPMVDSIKARKNLLVRPPVANIDTLFVVVSTCRPEPNCLVIDRVTAAAEYNDIEPVIVITKNDLAADKGIGEIYKKAGYKVVAVDYETGAGLEELRQMMQGKISAFAGNSGVGKSTLLNAIEPDFSIKTAQISDKLGRGRHTTRTVELYSLSFGGRVADTPGFSSFEGEMTLRCDKEELELCFNEFAPYIESCQFKSSCAHLKEKGCAVLAAVKRGEIAKSRHESYCAIYEELKAIKPWEKK